SKMAYAFPDGAQFLAPYIEVDEDDAIIFATRFYQRVLMQHQKQSYASACKSTAKELQMRLKYRKVWLEAD
ncbi:MAG: hypothetical protein ACRECH_17305, partial [Nitrososphaerales archaeon]